MKLLILRSSVKNITGDYLESIGKNAMKDNLDRFLHSLFKYPVAECSMLQSPISKHNMLFCTFRSAGQQRDMLKKSSQLQKIGDTGLSVSRIGLGGGGIGGLYTPVSEQQAVDTVLKAFDLGITYLDTAPLYGMGKSEIAIGKAIAKHKPERLTISTKVGILPSGDSIKYDFGREGILKSFESSLTRLGLDRIDIAFIHYPEDHYDEALANAYTALLELKSQGRIRAIGVGMNQWQMEERFAREGSFDCFLLAGRYTLLDQSAISTFLPLCLEKGISVILGGPFNSGILASDSDRTSHLQLH